MKDQFIAKLKATNRAGIDKVIDYLEKSGFFEAPASTTKHLSRDGGLVEHSLDVLRMAMGLCEEVVKMRPELAERLPENSVVIAALLHDVCKSSVYKKGQRWRKDAMGRWESYDTFEADYSRFPVGHGEKSVIMLLRLGLELTNDEIVAIRWHMSAWNIAFQSFEEKSNIAAAYDEYPLAAIIQAADGLAAHLLEVD